MDKGNGGPPTSQQSRKQLRKQARAAKKQRRAQYQAVRAAPPTGNRGKRPRPRSPSVENDTAKRKRTRKEPRSKKVSSAPPGSHAAAPLHVPADDVDPEDEEIRQLEAKLGLAQDEESKSSKRKWKKLNRLLAQDGMGEGLGDFLRELDDVGKGVLWQEDAAEHAMRDGYASDEAPPDEEMTRAEEVMRRHEEDDTDDAAKEKGEARLHQEESRRHELAAGREEGDEDSFDEQEEETLREEAQEAKAKREKLLPSIYGQDVPASIEKFGRTEDAASQKDAPGKYVPPGLRGKSGTVEGATNMRPALLRRVKGLLNRVSDSNLEPIATDLAGLFRSQSTREMTFVLQEALLHMCGMDVPVVRQLIMVYAALVAGLQILIGMDVAAWILEGVVFRIKEVFSLDEPTSTAPSASSPGDAATSSPLDPSQRALRENLTQLISYLFLFRVCDARLLVDVLGQFASRFREEDVEALYLSLRYVGFQVRSEDPAALRSLLRSVQECARQLRHREDHVSDEPAPTTPTATSEDQQHRVRTRMMLEMIADLRNNRRRQTQAQLEERGTILRKWLGGLARRQGRDGTDRRLHISWDDFLHIGSRGRWWLVGASWGGRRAGSPGTEQAGKRPATPSAATTADQAAMARDPEEARKEAELWELARVQRMNTDVRRRVFVAVMGATDVDHAMERLLKLNLKGPAEREIARVLIDCAGQEKHFNPFYGAVGARLCRYHPRFRFTFQLAFWDAIKLLGECPMRRIFNLAKFLAALIRRFSVSLSVLKIFDFTTIHPTNLLFLRACVGSILSDCRSDEDLTAIFSRCVVGLSFRTSIRIPIRDRTTTCWGVDFCRFMGDRVGNGNDRGLVRDGLSLFLHKFMKAHIHALHPSDSEDDRNQRKVLKQRLKLARQTLDNIPVDTLANMA